MGLDQYARVEDGNKRAERADTEFALWLDHPNLQGWMEKQWRYTGKTGEFNNEKVYLTNEILSELEADIKETSLPETNGFFYGQNSDEYYKQRLDAADARYYKEQDLKFVSDARGYINDGYKVYYSSWW